MGFLDKVKSSAAEATAKVKEGAEDVQTKREIGKTMDELGQKAYELAKAGSISHPDITHLVGEIDRLKGKLEDEGQGDGDGAAAEAEAPAPAPETPAASAPPPPPPSV